MSFDEPQYIMVCGNGDYEDTSNDKISHSFEHVINDDGRSLSDDNNYRFMITNTSIQKN